MKKSHFKVSTPEESSGLLLWQSTTLWQKMIKSNLENDGLSHIQFVVLASMSWFNEHHMETTQLALKNITKLEKMTLSKALKELTQMGYVERFEHKTDTRAKIVQLTEAGKEKISKVVPRVEEADEAFFSKLNKNERQELNTCLIKLNQ